MKLNLKYDDLVDIDKIREMYHIIRVNTKNRGKLHKFELFIHTAVSWEGLPVPDKYRGGYSQPTIALSTGSPMEELEKGPKELKGFVAL